MPILVHAKNKRIIPERHLRPVDFKNDAFYQNDILAFIGYELFIALFFYSSQDFSGISNLMVNSFAIQIYSQGKS